MKSIDYWMEIANIMIQNPDFDYEAYKKRYEPNATLIDPTTNISYNVCKRSETGYRSKKYKYLNINRIPLEFATRLQDKQPLVLATATDTYLLELYRTYPPAKSWQNITCKVYRTPLEFIERLEEWLKSHPPIQTSSTT